ncbi:alpha/beta-Hydrolases superfamily protein [Raphanus sativus]|nr:alpha/beta-Hydrolases superfamily protein [Raphanus sativus]
MVFWDPSSSNAGKARDFIRSNCHFSVYLGFETNLITAAHGIFSSCAAGFDTEIIVFSGGRFVFLGHHVLVLRNRSRRGGGDKPNQTKLSKSASATGIGSGDHGGGPIKGKSQFRGVLFKYGPKSIQVAFKTGEYKQQVIFIGGLTDGLLATDYLEPLAIALDKEKWSLVQLLMSSSYSGFGTSSLKQDAQEIDQLISYLINKENSEGVVLLGHSTGCQDIVYYMGTNAACSRAVRAAILQAPVSDREYKATLPETPAMIDLAANMIKEGRAEELMPREADPCAPISAYRYHSLCAYMGDDDMFSSDLSDDQLKN